MPGGHSQRHLTWARDSVKADQWGLCLLLGDKARNNQVCALFIITVIKLKGFSGVLLHLGGGAWGSRSQWISWKRGGVRGLLSLKGWGLEAG